MSYKNVGLLVSLFVLLNIQLICQNKVSIDLQSMHQNVGDTVNVPIQISTSGLRVAAYRLIIDFDNTVIVPLSCQGASLWTTFYNLQPTFVIIAGIKNSGQNSDFIGANLQFEVIGVPGQLTYLDITIKEIGNENGEYLLYENTNGQIAINCNDIMDVISPDFDMLDKGIFRANESLNSNSTIDQTVKTIEFRAGETILLDHHFEVTKGSTFHVLIQDCDDLSLPSLHTVSNPTTSQNKSLANSQSSHLSIEKKRDSDQSPQLGNAIRLE